MDKDFSELIEYLDGKFVKIDERFDVVDGKFVKIVDSYAKKADTYFQEMVMLSHKVDRLEKWINQVAEKVGVQLKV